VPDGRVGGLSRLRNVTARVQVDSGGWLRGRACEYARRNLRRDGKERNAHVRDRDLRRPLAVVLCLSCAGCLVCLARREANGRTQRERTLHV
jgi:hypothetical protein